ncbi:GNAT family N-acetyltransferase [Bacillus sp. JJ722]|uniref:GNAT family N-acetyltransferase n=1 Tax=Bacillus sp. JJ722 TaxID=3122973 RepID=UPI002FFED003
MYLRSWIPHTDRIQLIELAATTFNVNKTEVNKILRGAHDVIVIADEKDQIVGFLCYRLYLNHIAFVNYLVLDAKYRGKGIFNKMFPHAINYLKKKGIRGISGLVSRRNPRALKKFIEYGCIPIRVLPKHILIATYLG